MKDELFLCGVQVLMIKEVVCVLVLVKLELYWVCYLIDIGVGIGSVSIEVVLQNLVLWVMVIECQVDVLCLLVENWQCFGCDNIVIVVGVVLLVVVDKVDVIFMGGSGGYLMVLIDWLLVQLYSGGWLVMIFILQENFYSVLVYLWQSGIYEVDCQQLVVFILVILGSGYYFKFYNFVFVIVCQKEENYG